MESEVIDNWLYFSGLTAIPYLTFKTRGGGGDTPTPKIDFNASSLLSLSTAMGCAVGCKPI